jgi:hypothetical protein
MVEGKGGLKGRVVTRLVPAVMQMQAAVLGMKEVVMMATCPELHPPV